MAMWHIIIDPSSAHGEFSTQIVREDENSNINRTFSLRDHFLISNHIKKEDNIQFYFGDKALALPETLLKSLTQYFLHAKKLSDNKNFTCHQFALSLKRGSYELFLNNRDLTSNMGIYYTNSPVLSVGEWIVLVDNAASNPVWLHSAIYLGEGLYLSTYGHNSFKITTLDAMIQSYPKTSNMLVSNKLSVATNQFTLDCFVYKDFIDSSLSMGLCYALLGLTFHDVKNNKELLDQAYQSTRLNYSFNEDDQDAKALCLLNTVYERLSNPIVRSEYHVLLREGDDWTLTSLLPNSSSAKDIQSYASVAQRMIENHQKCSEYAKQRLISKIQNEIKLSNKTTWSFLTSLSADGRTNDRLKKLDQLKLVDFIFYSCLNISCMSSFTPTKIKDCLEERMQKIAGDLDELEKGVILEGISNYLNQDAVRENTVIRDFNDFALSMDRCSIAEQYYFYHCAISLLAHNPRSQNLLKQDKYYKHIRCCLIENLESILSSSRAPSSDNSLIQTQIGQRVMAIKSSQHFLTSSLNVDATLTHDEIFKCFPLFKERFQHLQRLAKTVGLELNIDKMSMQGMRRLMEKISSELITEEEHDAINETCQQKIRECLSSVFGSEQVCVIKKGDSYQIKLNSCVFLDEKASDMLMTFDRTAKRLQFIKLIKQVSTALVNLNLNATFNLTCESETDDDFIVKITFNVDTHDDAHKKLCNYLDRMYGNKIPNLSWYFNPGYYYTPETKKVCLMLLSQQNLIDLTEKTTELSALTAVSTKNAGPRPSLRDLSRLGLGPAFLVETAVKTELSSPKSILTDTIIPNSGHPQRFFLDSSKTKKSTETVHVIASRPKLEVNTRRFMFCLGISSVLLAFCAKQLMDLTSSNTQPSCNPN